VLIIDGQRFRVAAVAAPLNKQDRRKCC